ncbi:MAG: YibE/F family protein [Oscillospiraceae bacterium]
MKNKNYRNVITSILVTIISIILIIIGNYICKPNIPTNDDELFYKAKIILIEKTDLDEFSLDDGETTISNKNIVFTAKITNGDHKGEEIVGSQYIDALYFVQPKEIEIGDNIVVSYTQDPQTSDYIWQFAEYNRMSYIMWLVAIFFVIIILIGSKKGIATIMSLVFTGGAIFLVYIPAILKGYNIYTWTCIVSLFVIFMSLILINGVNKKTLAAILGNTGGVLVAGLLGLFMNNLLDITGFIDESSAFLMDIGTAAAIDLKAIVWGSIVIGSLGAIMDVAMSIASAMNEFSETMENKSFKKMLKSGMNVGRDAIGTMTNTLILAYIGGSLATVLLILGNNKNLLFMMNLEMIVVEIIKSLVGSMGILFAVPVTAIFSAYIFNTTHKNHD